MQDDAHIDRRRFVQQLALLAGAAALPLGLPACRSAPSPPSAPKVLTPHEWAVVEAATSRILPTDDLPGAREANVAGFIDAQLAAPSFAVFRREVKSGVRALDRLARGLARVRFEAAKDADQDSVLAAVALGQGRGDGLDTAHFFQVLFVLTLEGFLSDPAHGGNAGGVGWQVIGYAPAPPHPHRGGHG